MKTSIVLLVLIFINTTALLSESLAQLVNGINPWFLGAFEIVLLITLFLHHVLKRLHQSYEVDFKGLKVFVVKSKDTTPDGH